MIPAHAVHTIRESFTAPDRRRRVQALAALGWGRDGANIVWNSLDSNFGRLHLGQYPTAASVALSPGQVEDSTWWHASLGGYRWCLDLGGTDFRWCDLATSSQWSSQPEDLTAGNLEGLTPDYFARIGRFEPTAPNYEDLSGVPKSATDFMLQQISGWWISYLGDQVCPEEVPRQKEAFVHLLAALILLRTIEDLGCVPWLRYGSLLSAVRGRDSSALSTLFLRAAKELNSRVFKRFDPRAIPRDRIIQLIDGLYKHNLDFSRLEVDPVASAYEKFLGSTDIVTPQPQTSLFGLNQRVTIDKSARRALGAYFTPRLYSDTIARHLALPAANVAEDANELPIVLDLACGSGELLCAAMRQVFSLSAWRSVDVMQNFLERKLFGVDINPLALQLTALNILRTAVQLVPEILQGGRKFPDLERTLYHGDSLSARMLSQLPEADIALLNPPFHSRADWTSPPDELPEINQIGSRPNQAFAFLVAAITKLRDGGGISAILPSQLLSGQNHDKWRQWVSARISLDTVIANYSTPFEDVLSYAGFIIGHKVESHKPVKTKTITVPGGLKFSDGDVSAMIAGAGQEFVRPDVNEIRAHSCFVRIGSDDTYSWLPKHSLHQRRHHGRHRVSLGDLIDHSIFRGVEPAPKPWGHALFLFDEVPGGRVKHRATGKEFRGDTAWLRNCALSNWLGKVPQFCEPIVEGVRIFLPGRGNDTGIDVQKLERQDPLAYSIASHIQSVVVNYVGTSGAKVEKNYRDDFARGHLRYRRNNGYRDLEQPLIVMAKATRSPAGRKRGILWSARINLDGSVVPMEGLHIRITEPTLAVGIAVLFNTPEVLESIVASAPVRNEQTTQPGLSEIKDWLVPDLERGEFAAILGELYDVFVKYRALANTLSPLAAVDSAEYRQLIKLGASLWQV